MRKLPRGPACGRPRWPVLGAWRVMPLAARAREVAFGARPNGDRADQQKGETMRKLIALTFLFVTPAGADEPCSIVRQAYAPAENLEAIDAELLGRATKTIDMAAYVLTSIPIVEALDRAAARGVRVRLYRDGADVHMPAPLAEAYDRLAARKTVEIRHKASPAPLMHLKSYLVDEQILRDGSGNFSHGGLLRQDNSLFALSCPAAARHFQHAFDEMWRR